jgi:hypothetical protein
MQHIGKKEFLTALGKGLILTAFGLFIIFSSIWVCMAIWIQQPLGWLFSRVLIGVWIVFALSILGIYVTQHLISRRVDLAIYLVAFIAVLIWYFSIPALQNRDWNPEVAKILSYERTGNLVTLHNIRNFDWKPDGSYTERWETRHLNLDKISGVNIVTSYWMGPQIAHTLVSFNFSDQAPLVFSIEIRKEKNENFSAVGGFLDSLN